ncbi:MAG: hemerythrin domain-containing protein [Blastocatellia bacterium]|nr:hemerythrin domain-containing protein [Blastocatellia bacterium]MCS7157396.1 hemerythrin domain-containing protein [Blastocatellia bacterium]MCX7752570.1 hemerythrin domain-containing protein [Blastocatellia bacterium]MDW8168301.1 hemerythrin domain-containing protein [Acidobacteriota bacterium]MDW8255497.1 hemerythrin domain-containing protein [Acidobacteriota bacterium]
MARRHESLIPLSHGHHHGLVLSWRIKRALARESLEEEALRQLARAVVSFFESDLAPHFAAEEEGLFPIMEANLGRLDLLMELREEHERFRAWIEELRRSIDASPSMETLRAFGVLLHDHIRKEERVLFPIFEERMPPDEARRAGSVIVERLTSRSRCGVPKRDL